MQEHQSELCVSALALIRLRFEGVVRAVWMHHGSWPSWLTVPMPPGQLDEPATGPSTRRHVPSDRVSCWRPALPCNDPRLAGRARRLQEAHAECMPPRWPACISSLVAPHYRSELRNERPKCGQAAWMGISVQRDHLFWHRDRPVSVDRNRSTHDQGCDSLEVGGAACPRGPRASRKP